MNRVLPVEVWRPATDAPAPMLCLLDGVDSPSPSGWLLPGSVQNTLAGEHVTLVMPARADGSLHADWQRDDPVLSRRQVAVLPHRGAPTVARGRRHRQHVGPAHRPRLPDNDGLLHAEKLRDKALYFATPTRPTTTGRCWAAETAITCPDPDRTTYCSTRIRRRDHCRRARAVLNGTGRTGGGSAKAGAAAASSGRLSGVGGGLLGSPRGTRRAGVPAALPSG